MAVLWVKTLGFSVLGLAMKAQSGARALTVACLMNIPVLGSLRPCCGHH